MGISNGRGASTARRRKAKRLAGARRGGKSSVERTGEESAEEERSLLREQDATNRMMAMNLSTARTLSLSLFLLSLSPGARVYL